MVLVCISPVTREVQYLLTVYVSFVVLYVAVNITIIILSITVVITSI